MNDIQTAISELSLSGAISLGQCSRSTLYRWTRQINDRLSFERYDWRVKAHLADMSIRVDPDWTRPGKG